MLDSGMEKTHNHQGIPVLFSPRKLMEEEMIQRVHGIDRHKRSATISVMDREGREIKFIRSCGDLNSYIQTLGSEDAVVFETGLGSFYWADKIEETGALCFIINPYKFRIIKDSWNKTDKQDSRNMAKALWVHVVTGEFGLPVVHKPSREVRELRRLFSVYEGLNKHLVMLKNSVQSILTENGIVLLKDEKKLLLSEKTGLSFLEKLDISEASTISIHVSLEILWKVQEQKEQLAKKIFYAGKPFEKEVKLLISIKGITPLSALAFLSDVGDVRRFKTTRKMNAYLGLVPKLKESGDSSHAGHINRASRKTTRTLLTQSLVQAMFASPSLNMYYENVKDRRGAGRARIALIRKLCGVMRRMLLTGEQFRGIDIELYNKKVRQFDRTIKKMDQEKKSA
jgi:transposase